MDMSTTTLPKKGLKKYDYNIDMDITTLPEKGLKKYDYNIGMNKGDLKKLSKNQLIKLLMEREVKKPKVVIVDDTKPTRPTPPPRTGKWENVKPKPVPRKSVKQMVKEYEDIIQQPEQFRDGYKPIPKPRTDRPLQMRRPPKPTRKPPPPPILQLEDKERITDVSSPKITQIQKALKNSTKSFAVDIIDNKKPLHQLTETKKVIEQYLNKELGELKGFKYIEPLKITFEKQQGDGTTTKTAYFNSKTKTLINEINEVLQTSRQEIMKAISQWISEGSGWTILSVDGHYINLTKYKPLNGNSYIELPAELRNPAKGLINIKNKDNECLDGATSDI